VIAMKPSQPKRSASLRVLQAIQELHESHATLPPLNEANLKDLILKKFRSIGVFLDRVKHVLSTEKAESKEMLRIYLKALKGEATRDEIQFANAQLLDVFKILGITSMYLLPFGATALVLTLETLAKKHGRSIFPASAYS